MDYPRLTFPVTVDFGGSEYWINDIGPFRYGAAATALLQGDNLGENEDGAQRLVEEMEELLLVFGSHLHPYAMGREVCVKVGVFPKQIPVECFVCLGFHSVDGNEKTMVESWTLSNLRDFLYVELGKAIQKGNAPRQCRLCGRWFLHEQGDKTVYCERIAPGETEQTCREIGARAVFEKKIQEEDTWKIYKRAYKKYYARFMKGRMEKGEFKVWAEGAAAERDSAIKRLALTPDEVAKMLIIGQLKEKLNDR